jgi:hypothetical protein
MLREKYETLSARMNKRKSAVAVARKMVTLAWLLIRKKEFYRGADKAHLQKKFKFYGLKFEQWESIA